MMRVSNVLALAFVAAPALALPSNVLLPCSPSRESTTSKGRKEKLTLFKQNLLPRQGANDNVCAQSGGGKRGGGGGSDSAMIHPLYSYQRHDYECREIALILRSLA